MEEGKPSKTAIGAAIYRAAHLILDDEPYVFRDDFALRFSGIRDEAALKAFLESLYQEFAPKMPPDTTRSFLHSCRAYHTMRQRYTDDELAKAMERGVSQYVILGAGLDSFAYRRRDLENRLRVYEVDFPATQQWKKMRLRELSISVPRNLTFVPVDFEKQTFTDELITHGYRKDIPAFFSMLGVTFYLTEAAIFQTFRQIVSMAPGSEIVFDYALPETLFGEGERQIWALSKSYPGEPAIRQYEPTELMERLKALGFSEIWDFGPGDANTRYFNSRTDGLSASVLEQLPASVIRLFHIMKARV